MSDLWIRDARVLTLAGPPVPRRGSDLSELGTLDRASVLVRDGRVAGICADEAVELAVTDQPDRAIDVIDASGRVLMPAFVDCHTHACWAGSRIDEWEQKIRGATYLELLEAGGGIMATVRAVRDASQQELTAKLRRRLDVMLRHGTTCVEIKSGYGLNTDAELKMLRAIRAAALDWPGRVRATACLGHAVDLSTDDHPTFVRRTVHETLPAVSAEFPGITVDAYCEQGAWSLDDCLSLFDAAQQRGHPIRVHADQFNAMGMVTAAVERSYCSVDHLEATADTELQRLASSSTFGVMLPCCGFHLDGRYGRARRFVDFEGALALATNDNPGSAPCCSIPMVISLAVRHLGLKVAESIAACTVNAAALLGIEDAGTIGVGQRADLILLRHHDERQLAYEFGGNPVDLVICGGIVT